MVLFSKPIRKPKRHKSRKNQAAAPIHERPSRKPALEPLEDRVLLSSNIISGHVFNDLNNNGLFDAGETAIANNPIELHNDQGVVVATTTTDANGYYQFDSDGTINTDIQTLEQTIEIPSTLAGFELSQLLDQFDPSQGQLVEVEIVNDGAISSDIRAENSSTHVGADITGVISGRITLIGPNFTLESDVSENAGTFSATAFDGVIDFDGTSGKQFDQKVATAPTKSISLTGADVAPFIGTGQVNLTEKVVVNSTASGGGNLLVGITSEASATITVRYKYRMKSDLRPGDYTIVQTQQPMLPDGSGPYWDGQEFTDGTPVPNSIGQDEISVTLTDSDLTENNFTEIKPSSLAGKVYYDQNNDGVQQTDSLPNGQLREPGIGNVTITLTGTNDAGQSVFLTTTTAADGTYKFDNLRPGNYSIAEEQPADYQDGIESVGTAGGVAGDNNFTAINLDQGTDGADYNFGETKGGTLSGYVFHDISDNGLREAGEPGIGGVTVRLLGTTLAGAPIDRTVTTSTQPGKVGYYQFTEVPAGTYEIIETQPGSFYDGKDGVGSLGGDVANDHFSNIVLPEAGVGQNYNFGELKGGTLSGLVFEDLNNNGFKDGPNEAGVGGVPISLTGAGATGVFALQTTTNPDGTYAFNNLPIATYSIRESQPQAYADGKDTLGSLGGNANSNDLFENIVLQEGASGTNYNFAELPFAKLSGFVFADTNNNGQMDAGEKGIANVPIELTHNDLDAIFVDTTTTAADGSYSFDDVIPGEIYTLTESQNPQGYADGKDSVGTQGGTLHNDSFTDVVLLPGEIGENNNFGERLVTDVGVLKEADPAVVLAGGQIVYDLTVSNFGPSTASNVQVVDTLPPDVVFQDVIAPGWDVNLNGNTLVFTRDHMITGTVSSITIIAQAPIDEGEYLNTVTVTTSTPDNNPDNDTDTALVTVPSAPISPLPPPIPPQDPPGEEVLSKALILASSDFWISLLAAN